MFHYPLDSCLFVSLHRQTEPITDLLVTLFLSMLSWYKFTHLVNLAQLTCKKTYTCFQENVCINNIKSNLFQMCQSLSMRPKIRKIQTIYATKLPHKIKFCLQNKVINHTWYRTLHYFPAVEDVVQINPQNIKVFICLRNFICQTCLSSGR